MISGSGNVAIYACETATDFGAKVVAMSDSDGYVYDPDGVCTQEKFDFMAEMRAGREDRVETYALRFGLEFFPGKKPWEMPGDIMMPCATQNKIAVEGAVRILVNRVGYYVEAANMPATPDALRLLRLSPDILVAGAKASGAGGRGGLRPGDGPELPALQLAEEAGGGAAAADHGGHPRRLRRGGGGLQAGLRT